MVISIESKAFFKSRNIEHVILPSLILFSNLPQNVVIARLVELFSLKPNCKGVKMLILFINFIIFVLMIFSNTFEKTHRSETGRKSPSDLGDETLAMGTTYAILNESGKVSSFLVDW